ncbi:hypothetical protein MHYP_G00364810 [Metynnis hypsauchen]
MLAAITPPYAVWCRMVLEDRAGPGPEAAAQSQRREQVPGQRESGLGLSSGAPGTWILHKEPPYRPDHRTRPRALSDPQCGTEEGGNKGKEWKKRTEVGFSPPLPHSPRLLGGSVFGWVT